PRRTRARAGTRTRRACRRAGPRRRGGDVAAWAPRCARWVAGPDAETMTRGLWQPTPSEATKPARVDPASLVRSDSALSHGVRSSVSPLPAGRCTTPRVQPHSGIDADQLDPITLGSAL